MPAVPATTEHERPRSTVAPDPDPPSGVVIDEPPVPAVQRSRADVVRLVTALVTLAVGLFLARVLPQPLVSTERALIDGLHSLPAAIEQVTVIVIQVGAAYLPLAFLVSHLVRRQFRRLGVAAISAVVAALLMRVLYELLDTPRATAMLSDLGRQVLRSSSGFPSPTYLAAATAVIAVEVPWIGRRWRHLTVGLIVALSFARIASGTTLPRDLVAALAAGWVVGCAALLLFGSNNRRPRGRDIVEAMERAGVPLASVTWSDVPLLGAQGYSAVTRDGRPIFLKVRSRDDRATDVLIRFYRRLRLRDEREGAARISLQQLVEHEALVATKARADDIPTLRMIAVANVGFDGVLIAFEGLPAARLVESPDELTDEQLRCAWEIVGRLRAARIAHRRLALHSFIQADGKIYLIDFTSGVLAPTDALLDGDIAELLTDSAVHIGSKRAVRIAVDALGPETVAAALPRLQPLALTRRTRHEIGSHPGMLDELRETTRAATGAPVVPLAELERVKPRTVLLVAASAVAFYFLVPQLADISGIWNELKQASPAWIVAGLALAALSFVGAAVALRGSMIDPPAFLPSTEAQVASSFANFATPAQVGGLALNLRFLQKQGSDPAVAAAAVGLDTVAGIVVHLALLGAFLFAAGSQTATDLTFPWEKIAIGIGAILAVAAVTLAVPLTRKVVAERVLPLVKRSAGGIAAVGKRPTRLLALLAGSLVVTLAYAGALIVSVEAVGGDASAIDVVVVYLIGSAIATAAPTPGGLGAVEAAMVGGLAGVGMPAATAVSAVLVYRGVTFWAPLLPGWLAFGRLQRRGAL